MSTKGPRSLFSQLERYDSRVAVLTEKAPLMDYCALLAAADQIGRHLSGRSLTVLVCRNSPQAIAGYVGLLRANSVVLLVHDTIDESFFASILKKYRPQFLFCPADKIGLIGNAHSVYSHEDYLLARTEFTSVPDLHEDLAILLTTSGSTGSPKLVRLSYSNLDSNAASIADYLEIGSTDRAITTMPMSYSYGLSIVNSHLLRGASIVLTEATLFDRQFWNLLRNSNATTFGGVPYVYQMLKKLRFERMELPSLRYITQAGGKLSPDLCVEFADVCSSKGLRFVVMYGQTEATARMSYLPWTHARSKAGSIGIPIPGGKFRLEADDGNVIDGPNVQGELVYEGSNVSMGYAEGAQDLAKGDENRGVLRTGDIATRDVDGFYFIVGRKKRFLKMFGKRVSLDEVEQLLATAGYECACSGTDDNLQVFMTAAGRMVELRAYLAERTGISAAGIHCVHISKIPKNPSGKVLYADLG